MKKKQRILSLATISMMLVCSSACAEESTMKMDAKKAPSTTVSTTGATGAKVDQPVTQAEILKVSEAFGNFVGRNLKAPGNSFDLESIIKGMRDGYAGKPSPLTDKEYETLMARVQQQAFKKLSENNLKEASNFLAKNAKEAKVVEIEPGKLQYLIIKEGTGEAVVEHNSPQINYEGKFLDGKAFGNSKDAGGPITVPLDQTIPGFSKGILGMREGEKRILYVHPELGYGTTGHMPPNSLLIFEIELVKANTPEQTADDDSDDLEELSMSDDDDEDDISDDDDDDDDDDVAPKKVVVSPSGATGAKSRY